MDVTSYTLADSDQINASDIPPGGVLVQISGTRPGPVDPGKRRKDGSPKRRLDVLLDGYPLPWRPSKGMIRVLRDQWGADSHAWVGRWLRLYREDSITFGSDTTGGIRIQAMDHLDAEIQARVKESRGKARIYVIIPCAAPTGDADHDKPRTYTADDLAVVMEARGVTEAQLTDWLKAHDMPAPDDLDERALAWLAGRVDSHPDEFTSMGGEE